VQLLVAVEEGWSRIVGNEIELDFLKAAEHHHFFDDARSRLAADTRQLEAVPMQV
jgi:hypothetical protein